MATQLRLNGKQRHFRCCTLDGRSLAVLIIRLQWPQTSFFYTKTLTAESRFGLAGKIYEYMHYYLTVLKVSFMYEMTNKRQAKRRNDEKTPDEISKKRHAKRRNNFI